ncbi:UDP-N-acetylmuramate dehydrogenase [Ruminococcus difficilis]|uniref:UDP-N-acetylenolpyruvoylglucosamine reductase n=1 Tax=Ruminococcus difficilis TaxID=2763069 RepID=A0A934U0A6_9FIRM|nr:UDP-N-acetylmuramate dehydrogenase [Ruminococcus difficilis]MBK6088113.1 UDP-N-acetylmuramate dehydrogenase [Ruminococcus difficilis]
MNQLINTLNDNHITYTENEPMSAHTTFKIGGAADILITVNHIDELQTALGACKASDIPVMILGNGSNLLVSDNGIEGAVITLDGDFKEITVDGDIIISGAGAKLSRLCSVALENSLTGLEFAYGIPGSVGGAMYMNAGAYGGEMKDVALSVTALTPDGEIREVPAEELALGYRTSVFKTNGDIILFAKYKLAQGDPVAIKEKMDDVMNRRKTKQPLEYPSAGSVFKRPEGAFAGTLIEQCGLKGKTVGGAQVSEKHAGFIINIGGATCDDVMGLVKLVQETVKAETGYFLEREIIRTGRE